MYKIHKLGAGNIDRILYDLYVSLLFVCFFNLYIILFAGNVGYQFDNGFECLSAANLRSLC